MATEDMDASRPRAGAPKAMCKFRTELGTSRRQKPFDHTSQRCCPRETFRAEVTFPEILFAEKSRSEESATKAAHAISVEHAHGVVTSAFCSQLIKCRKEWPGEAGEE